VPGEAREKLKRLQKEGKTPMNEHIATFKTLVNQAKIGKDKEALTAGTGWCFPQKNPFLDMFCDF